MRAFRIFTIANLVFLVVIWLSERFIAERHWLTTFITYAPQQPLGIPTLFLLFLSFRKKNKKFILLNTVSFLFFVFAILGFNIPLLQRHYHNGVSIRVMTFNVHQAASGTKKLSEIINKYHPDVLCVQEVGAYDQRGEPVTEIMRQLPGWYHARDGGELAILSRYPILRSSFHYLPACTQRAIFQATIKVRGRRINVLTTHFIVASNHDSLMRRRSKVQVYLRDTALVRLIQKDRLLSVAATFEEPLVITGDFNTPPNSQTYRHINSRYQDAFKTAGFGFGYTFHSEIPCWRIDHIFVDNSTHVERCFAPRTSASDHRPIIADILIH